MDATKKTRRWTRMIGTVVKAYLRLRGRQVDRPEQPRPPVTTYKARVEHRPTADQHFVWVEVCTEKWEPEYGSYVWVPNWTVRCSTYSLHHRVDERRPIGAPIESVHLAYADPYPFPSRESALRAVSMWAESLGMGSTTEPAFAVHRVGSGPLRPGAYPAILNQH